MAGRRLRLRVAPVFLGACALLLAFASSASALIAFESSRCAPDPNVAGDCGPGIWLMNDDGSNLRRLTRAVADGTSHVGPIWYGHRLGGLSPSGRYLVTARKDRQTGSRIWVWDLQTGAAKEVSPPRVGGTGPYFNDDDASWAADERQVVFVSDREPGTFDLYRLDLATDELVRLTHDGTLKRNPRFTPDGQRVVFNMEGLGYDPGGNGSGTFTVAAAGGDLRRLTSSELVRAAAYSPDGSQLAFSTKDGLFVMRVDGSEVRQLVPNRLVWNRGTGVGWAALGGAFADGGRSLLFTGVDSDVTGSALFKVPLSLPPREPVQLPVSSYSAWDGGAQWAGTAVPLAGIDDDAAPAVELIDSQTGEITTQAGPAGAASARRFAIRKRFLDLIGLDGTGLRRIHAAVARETRDGRCRFLTGARFGPARDCRKRKYFAVASRVEWQNRIAPVPAGRPYSMWLRGSDVLGNGTRRPQRVLVHLKR